MGQNPEPTQEEIELVFGLLKRGLSNGDIVDEMQDTEFPRRTDPRYFRKMRRFYQAAKIVFAEAPTYTPDKRDHTELLVSALANLRRPPSRHHLADCWDWVGEKALGALEARPQLEKIAEQSLELACLASHVDPGDPLFEKYRLCGVALDSYWQLCTDVYRELMEKSKEVAAEFGIAILLRNPTLVPALTTGFVDTLYNLASELVAGHGISGKQESDYDLKTVDQQPELFDIRFGNSRIAYGNKPMFKAIKKSHKEFRINLTQTPLIDQIRTARDSYDSLVSELNRLIDVKTLQRVFLKGPCEICDPWGGL